MNFSSRTRDLGCEKLMYSAMMESRSQPWSLRRQPIMHPVRCCWDLVSYTIKSPLGSWSVPCPCCNVPKRVGYSLWPKFAKSGQWQHPGSSQLGLCLDVLGSDGGLCLLPREKLDDLENRVLRRGSYNSIDDEQKSAWSIPEGRRATLTRWFSGPAVPSQEDCVLAGMHFCIYLSSLLQSWLAALTQEIRFQRMALDHGSSLASQLWVSKKRWKVIRDMRHKLTSLTVGKRSQLII